MFTQEQIEKLIALADKLDSQGLHQEADRLDGMIKEAGVGDWLKGVWEAIKGNPQLKDAMLEVHAEMKRTTVQLKEAVEKVLQTVATLEKLTEKPQLQHMAKWAELVKGMGEEIKITIQAAKAAAEQHKKFEDLSKQTRELKNQPPAGVSGLGPAEEAAKPDVTTQLKKKFPNMKDEDVAALLKVQDPEFKKLLGA